MSLEKRRFSEFNKKKRRFSEFSHFFSLSYPTHVLEWGRPLFGNAYDRLHITFASTPAFDAQKQAKNWKMRTMKTTRKVP